MLLPFIAIISLSQQAHKADWVSVRLEEPGISVEFPKKPRDYFDVNSGRNSRNPEGVPSRLSGFQTIWNQSGFTLVKTDLKVEEKPETFLPKAWDEHVVKQAHITQIEKEFKQWKGFPTVEGTYQLGTRVKARVRLFVIGQRLIQQVGTWTTSADRDEVVDRFFGSLKFD